MTRNFRNFETVANSKILQKRHWTCPIHHGTDPLIQYANLRRREHKVTPALDSDGDLSNKAVWSSRSLHSSSLLAYRLIDEWCSFYFQSNYNIDLVLRVRVNAIRWYIILGGLFCFILDSFFIAYAGPIPGQPPSFIQRFWDSFHFPRLPACLLSSLSRSVSV